MNVAYNKVIIFHLLSKFLALLFSVHINETLINIDVAENFDQVFEFLLIVFARNVELFDTFKSQVFFFDENFRGVVHDVFGELNDFVTDGGREQTNLTVGRNEFDDFVDLF